MHHHGRQLEDRSGQKETAWLVADGRARHLWRLSAVSTGFPFLGQRGAHIIPNRVRMRVENLFIALPISVHLPPQNHG